MKRIITVFAVIFSMTQSAHAVTARSTTGNTASQTAAYNYNYMYPYLNNQMRTALNPGGVTPTTANPINAVVRTDNTNSINNTRRVVSRGGASAARSATRGGAVTSTNTAAAARSAAKTATASNTNARRVTARSMAQNATVRSGTRADATYANRTAQNAAASAPDAANVSSAQCLADYTKCMDGYCARENTEYNRCYCSSKLSQIDAEYQPAIDSLIKQMLTMKNTGNLSQSDFNKYWMSMVGQYTGTNSWENLDNALNIDWASLESRVRGQNAFLTGHDYCAQHLRGCFYMATNLRDAYRSEIARDCATYEKSLQKIKIVAESIVENNK